MALKNDQPIELNWRNKQKTLRGEKETQWVKKPTQKENIWSQY